MKNGAPASAPVTGADIVGLEWAFEWFGMTDVAYAAEVTVRRANLIRDIVRRLAFLLGASTLACAVYTDDVSPTDEWASHQR